MPAGQSFYTVSYQTQEDSSPPSVHKFLVGQGLGQGAIADRAAESSAAFGVPVVPFAGVAAPLNSPGESPYRTSLDGFPYIFCWYVIHVMRQQICEC